MPDRYASTHSTTAGNEGDSLVAGHNVSLHLIFSHNQHAATAQFLVSTQPQHRHGLVYVLRRFGDVLAVDRIDTNPTRDVLTGAAINGRNDVKPARALRSGCCQHGGTH